MNKALEVANKLKEAMIASHGKENCEDIIIHNCSEEGANFSNNDDGVEFIWEGGPEEWAQDASMSPWMLSQQGVFAEPYNHFVLNLHNEGK